MFGVLREWRWPAIRFAAALSIILALPIVARSEGTDDIPVRANACIVELLAPPDARITVDGRDYRTKRTLTYEGLKPSPLVLTRITARFADGSTRDRNVWLMPGQRIRVPLQPPRTRLPEIVVSSGGWCSHAAISADGQFLLTADGNVARLWAAASGRLLRVYEGHTRLISGLAFGPDGKRFATGSYDESIIVWDRDTGRRQYTTKLDRPTYAIAWSPDGSRILTGESINAVLIDALNGRIVSRWREHADCVDEIAFSPDGRSALIGSRDGTVELREVASGRKLRVLPPHSGWVDSVGFAGDGKWVVTTAHNHDDNRYELMITDAGTGKLQNRREFKSLISNAVCDPSGKWIAVRERRGENEGSAVLLLDPNSLLTVGELTPPKDRGGRHLALSADGKLLFDGDLVWNMTQRQRIASLVNESAQLYAQALWASEANTVFARSFEGIYSIDARSGELQWSIKRPPRDEPIVEVRLSEDESQVLALVENKKEKALYLVVFGTNPAQEARRFRVGSSDGAADLTISADARFALVRTGEYTATLWNVREERPVYSIGGDKHQIFHCALSRDGTRILIDPPERSTSRRVGNRLEVTNYGAACYDAMTGKFQKSLLSPETATVSYNVSARAFTPNGRSIVLGGDTYRHDGQPNHAFIALYDATNGQRTNLFHAAQTHVDALSFTPDSRFCISQSDDGARSIVWDMKSAQPLRSFQGHYRFDDAPSLTPDGRRLLTVHLDHSLRWHDVATGDELLRYIRLEKSDDWLAVTPEGLFDGTEKARQSVSFRVGGGLNVVPVDSFFQAFYYPGLMAAVARGERPLPGTEFGSRYAPLVKITAPKQGATMDQQRTTIVAEVTDQGGGMTAPWLLQNGARVLADEKIEKSGKTARCTFTVSLISGENRFEVYSASGDRSWESAPARLVLNYEKPLERPAVHVLAVGINRYQDEAMNLRFAAGDARAIAELFSRRGPKLYGPDHVHVTSLVDDQATAPAIRQALTTSAKAANTQDTFVVFLAGHGVTIGQRYYYIPHEFKPRAESLEDDIRQQGLPADALGDLLAQSPALKRVLIFDTCHAAGALPTVGVTRDPFAFRGALERLSRATGTFTLAATAANDRAFEAPQLNHGVLTYSLLAGVGAVADGPLVGQRAEVPDSDRTVGVRDWFSFAQDKVPLLTRLYFNYEQYVTTSGQGSSFPLLPLAGEEDLSP